MKPLLRRPSVTAVVAAGAVGWALQHRTVRHYRSAVASFGSAAYEAFARSAGEARSPGPRWEDDLAVPGDVTHHTVVTDDGGRIHAIERGSGSPILLVHGVTLDATIWAYQLRDLAGSHRVVAIDQRGHGASLGGSGGYGIARLAGDIACVLEGLDLDGCLVVGHSLGGMAACELAATQPPAFGRVAGIALVATTGGITYGVPRLASALERAVTPAELVLEWAGGRGQSLLVTRDTSYWATRLAFGSSPSPAHLAVTEHMIAAMSPRPMPDILRSIVTWQAWGRLSGVGCPVAVVSGGKDRLTPPWHARRLAREIPAAWLVELPGAGHMVMLERRDDLAGVLMDAARGRETPRRRPRGT